MSVEEAIHERWSQFRPLTRYVPAGRDPVTNRLFTGVAWGEQVDLPYARMTRDGDAANQRTSSGAILSSVNLTLDIFDDRLDRAKAIRDEFFRYFNRAHFRYGGGMVQDIKVTNTTEDETDEGVWQISLSLQVRTEEHLP